MDFIGASYYDAGGVTVVLGHRDTAPRAGVAVGGFPKHMTLHKSVLESILAVCHKSSDSNPDELFGTDSF